MADSVADLTPCTGRHSIAQVSWQASMKHAIRNGDELLAALHLSRDDISITIDPDFPVFVPLEYLGRIEKGNPRDPLLVQVLPLAMEQQSLAGYSEDPVGDSRFEAAAGLIHKYHGRVLLITSGACGVHCRYCFRRHYPYQSAPKSIQQWNAAMDYISSDGSISEVILSGGDPLTIVDSLLAELIVRIEQIAHVKRLRFHTRMPVVIPGRVTHEFCEILEQSRLSPWIVLHINHAREIDQQVVHAVKLLRKSGANVLNQAVLLRGVNDDGPSLVELCERLVEIGVSPYYINQLDPVSGAAHFHVPVDRGLELMRFVQSRISGYAVPRYVQDAANHDLLKRPESKLPLL